MSAIANAVARFTTRVTRSNTAFGAFSTTLELASSNFVAGGKYWIRVCASLDLSSSALNGSVQVAHGGTAFAETEHSFQPATSTNRISYFQNIIWTAVSGENIELQGKTESTSATIGADQVVIRAIRLDVALTENTDYFVGDRATDDDLSATFLDGASVTWTPGTADQVWGLFFNSQIDPNSLTVQVECQGVLSGGTSSTFGLNSMEPEDTLDIWTGHFGRAIVLPASSHTFKEQSREETDSGGTRLHSKVFVINLSKFKDVSQAFTQTTEDYGTTAWADALGTFTHTKTVNGDIDVMAFCRDDFTIAGLGSSARHRLNVDDVDTPTSQTGDVYNYSGPLNDASDQHVYAMMDVVNITANALIDHDGHGSATTVDAEDRSLIVFSMELAAAGAFTLDAQPGSHSVAGAVAGLVAGFVLAANPGAYAITGADASVVGGRVANAEAGAYVVTGVEAGLVFVSPNIVLVADPGSYTITGAAAEILAGRVVVADPGAYTITGQTAGLLGTFVLSADPGTISLAGIAAGLVAGRQIGADPGGYTVTGVAAFTISDFVLSAVPGSHVLTGAPADLFFATTGIVLVANAGSYTLTGFLARAYITTPILQVARYEIVAGAKHRILVVKSGGQTHEV